MSRSALSARAQLRPLLLYAADATVWCASLLAAAWLRFEFDTTRIDWGWLVTVAVFAIGLHGVGGLVAGSYRRHWRTATVEELSATALVVVGVGLVSALTLAPLDTRPIPQTVPLIAAPLAMCGMMGMRAVWRLTCARSIRSSATEPLLVVGAGEAAYQIVRSLNAQSDGTFRPVALLDDDPLKTRLQFEGVRVEGVIDDLERVARQHSCHNVLLAIPSADSSLVRRVDLLCRQADLHLLVLPPVDHLFGTARPTDMRPVTDVDLLGRDPADIDPEAVTSYITGRRVLVTGAGGSIGSELCRQLASFRPSALMMLDRDESGLHGVQLSIEGRALLDDPNLLLADIRDADRIKQIFHTYRPEVVFHAAALKHLTLLESAPEEAWKTNVLGTHHVLDAADEVGATHFVNISTDKAADPTSVLGYSKKITERLTAHRAETSTGKFVSVRFGNVLGSRGSVLHAFRAQAEAGGPITVTDPHVTRYFMTVEEAVRLTIYAGAIGDSGEVLVLDMGQPVRIVDVAKRFAQQHMPPLAIEFTGLRPGEKLHENLVARDETGERRVHGLISHVVVPPLALAGFREASLGEQTVTKEALMHIARSNPLGVAS